MLFGLAWNIQSNMGPKTRSKVVKAKKKPEKEVEPQTEEEDEDEDIEDLDEESKFLSFILVIV